MAIYSFSNFGHEGSLVCVETDLREGIPSVDLIGMADNSVKETRKRCQAAILNSGFNFPQKRVLISLSPADLRKEGSSYDLGIALSILNPQIEENILILGELELNGTVRPVRGVYAAVETARSNGINKFIIPFGNRKECECFDGEFIFAESLKEAQGKIIDDTWERLKPAAAKSNYEVTFTDYETEIPEEIDKKLLRAITIAAAGKHHLFVTGGPACGKTSAISNLMPLITPKLTEEEARVVTRIHSLAGLLKPDETMKYTPPFRMPHQTASIEEICGGGPGCRPGEFSLAHNGVLFLDEAAEFRTSCLQMLRVPLELRQITLARAGRSTSFPTNFQLVMATDPCPCGNFNSPDKICLCSAKSLELYWKKIGSPLLDRFSLRVNVENAEKEKINIEKLRTEVKSAIEIQRERGSYNENMTPSEIAELIISDNAKRLLDKYQPIYNSQRFMSRVMKVACTIANMDGRIQLLEQDVREAIYFQSSFNPFIGE